jgi:anaerobic ribonucleoside-triphosphate reductase activating protein
MNTIRIHHIEACSYVDGPGPRAVAFVQGCSIHCPGCQNSALWHFYGGHERPVHDLAETLALLANSHHQVTISGGEPWDQQEALFELILKLCFHGVEHLIVYSGYTWEQLFDPDHPAHPYFTAALPMIDVLVDGPFVASLDDDFVGWRGSKNQRPIDVAASLLTLPLPGQEGEQGGAPTPVVLDWDNELTVTAAGDLIAPTGLAAIFKPLGTSRPSPICGQVKRS